MCSIYPAANVGSDLVNSNTFLSAPVISNSENLFTAKVDEHATRGDTISLHYSLVDENRFNPFDPVNAFTALPGYGSFTLLITARTLESNGRACFARA